MMKRGLTGTILWSLLALSVGVVLFVVKYEVKDLESRLADLNSQIRQNQENIHVLRAEWSFLNDPARLRALAEKHLAMRPITPTQVATLDTLPSEGIPATGAIYAATTPAKVALPPAAGQPHPAAKPTPPASKLAEASKPKSTGHAVALAKAPSPRLQPPPPPAPHAAKAPAAPAARRAIVIQSPALAERDNGGAQ